MGEELSEEEQQELNKLLGGNAPVQDEKHNVHTFISKVLTTKDTTKVGNLNEMEIGELKNPVRAFKSVSLFADKVMHSDALKDYFNQEAEIATATSLSRNAALLRFATTTARTVADLTKPKTESSSWFKSKKKDDGGIS